MTRGVYCHCSDCRRASGSAFAANAGVARQDFRVAAGTDLLRSYESSPNKFRWFCSRCGSPIYTVIPSEPNGVRIRLGTLEDDPGIRPDFHIFVGSKAPWHAITDELAQFAEWPTAKR
ncbi:MAG: GFA family protein [Myxococcota bacterium]